MSWRWLLDNPQILFVIAGAIAYWLNERRKVKDNREMVEEARREPDADEMAERTRRIQEEIRRKIEERQGRVLRPVVLEEEEGEGPASVPPPLPEARPVLVSVEDAPGAGELERVMEQQRRYAEQIERLAATERAAKAYASLSAQPEMAVYATTAAAPATKPAYRESVVLSGLHDRDALRRAILLREILGPAKGLQ